MLLYILIVASLNIALGFALAVHLGRRYRSLAGDPLLQLLNVAAAALPPEASANDEEALIRSLQSQVEQYYLQLTEADDKLREQAATPDAASIQECLSALQTATDQYRRQREAACSSLADQHPDADEISQLLAAMQEALERENTSLETTCQGMVDFDYQTDLQAGCRQLLSQTNQLASANHRLRDTLEGAMAGISRSQESATGPDGRVVSLPGLEAALARWWQDDPDHARQLSVALFDVDCFGQINEHWGHGAGDRLLEALAQCLQNEHQGEGLVTRLTGQRFLCLFPDADVRHTANAAEHIRQNVEATRFRSRDGEIRITLSCAAIGATNDDTPASLCRRAEAALAEAKRYGRNRTFLYEGEYPTPVVPPSFTVEEKLVTV